MASLESVTRLGDDLQASKAHINNAPILLSLLTRASDGSFSAPTECLLQALLSLQGFFVTLFSGGDLSYEAYKVSNKALKEARSNDSDQALAIYQNWLWNKYSEFQNLLLEIMLAPSVESVLQVAAADALMEFARHEKQGDFSNRMFKKICSSLVLCEDVNAKMHLVAKYFNCIDVCFYSYINMRKLIRLYLEKKKDEELGADGDATFSISQEALMCNICDFMMYLNVPKIDKSNDATTVLEYWSNNKKLSDPKSNNSKLFKKVNTDGNPSKSTNFQEVKKLKAKCTIVWITFLQLPLTRFVYEKVLAQMHKAVIPNLSNPNLLSDFLISSYNKGGLIGVMALNGLFSLITQHGLEYPDFYTKLYALLEPSIFTAKYRARFFELLDLCLKSPLLPSYLAAAFAKRLGRIALTAPPSGALIVIAIVHNLLRRHPSINCLVHKDFDDSRNSIIGEASNEGSEPVKVINQSTEIVAVQPGADPFDVHEEDPAKANALKSSLWEMDTLRRHYSPVVSRFVESLETDLTVRAKTQELDIKDFSSGSYSTIFSDEVKRRMKQVPLAFYKSCPTTLFPKNPKDCSLGISDFPGWDFDCKMALESGTEDLKKNQYDSTVDGNMSVTNRKKRSYGHN